MAFRSKPSRMLSACSSTGPWRPGGELVDIDTTVVGGDRFFDQHFPVGQIVGGKKPAMFRVLARTIFLGDIATIEAVIGCINGFLAALAFFKSRGLCFQPAFPAWLSDLADGKSRQPQAQRAGQDCRHRSVAETLAANPGPLLKNLTPALDIGRL